MVFRLGYVKSVFLKVGDPNLQTRTGVHVHNSLSQRIELQLHPLLKPSWHAENQLYL